MCVFVCFFLSLSQCVCEKEREYVCVLYAINLENMYI